VDSRFHDSDVSKFTLDKTGVFSRKAIFAWAAVATQPNVNAGFRTNGYKDISEKLQVHPVFNFKEHVSDR